MPQPNYRKLTPTRRTIAGSSELWLGDDHLLLVVRHWWTERYQRFRFADIQSIIVTERPSARTVQLGGLAVTLILMIAAVAPPLGAKFFFAIPLSLILIVQIVDLLRGTRCRVDLTTAVSSVRLPALRRMRVATRFLGRVQPFIEEAQGSLAPLPPPLPEETPAADVSAQPVAAAAEPPTLPQADQRRRVPELILFASATFLGAFSLAWLWTSVSANLASIPWALAAVAVVLAAIIGFGKTAPAVIRFLAIGILILGVVDLLVSATLFAQAIAELGTSNLNALMGFRPDWIRQWGPVLSFAEIGSGLAGVVLSFSTTNNEPAMQTPREIAN